ncbi:MAG: STAS domain-containing protein [Pseudonocardiaceae bacterium]
MTPVASSQLDTIIPAPPLGGPMVIATLSCRQPDTTLCTVAGSVDLAAAPVLADKLIEAVHDGRAHLVIDLSAVALIDSSALHAVFETLDCYDIDGHLAVVVDPRSDSITRLDITALEEMLDVHHELAGALRACARASISTGGRHRAQAAG